MILNIWECKQEKGDFYGIKYMFWVKFCRYLFFCEDEDKLEIGYSYELIDDNEEIWLNWEN